MRNGVGDVQSLLILGGNSDIALATVRAFVERGAHTVILAGRDSQQLAAAAETLRRSGARTVETVPFDAEDLDAHETLIDGVFDRHGDLDVVLLAAGILGERGERQLEAADSLALARVNYLGAISVIRPTARRLTEQGHGSLVVLSSLAAERPRRSNFLYGSTKAGLDAFAQGLGDSLAGTGVHVMIVRPGFVKTKMTAGLEPAPLATTPEAVARAIAEGIRRSTSIVWVPRILRPIGLVLRLLPRGIFRRLDM